MQGIKGVELASSPILYGCVKCVILRDKHRFKTCENEASGEVRECRTEELTE